MVEIMNEISNLETNVKDKINFNPDRKIGKERKSSNENQAELSELKKNKIIYSEFNPDKYIEKEDFAIAIRVHRN